MSDTSEVETFVMPRIIRSGSWNHKLRNLKVGESIIMPRKFAITRASVIAHRAGKALAPRKFGCRTTDEGVTIYRLQ